MEKAARDAIQESGGLSRLKLYLYLLASFLFPILILTVFASSLGITFFILAGVVSLGGIGCGWYLIQLWEKKMQFSVSKLVRARIEGYQLSDPPPNSPAVAAFHAEIDYLKRELEEVHRGYEHQINLLQSSTEKSKEEAHQLNLEMDKKLEDMRLAYLEFEDLRKEYHRLEEELQQTRSEAGKQMKHKEALIQEYKRTVGEQRMILEKKQRYISKLESKVRDLMYEIRSLLQLEEPAYEPTTSQVDLNEQEMVEYYIPSAKPHPYDLSLQLQRYLENAETFTGADHLGYVGGKSPRFLDMSMDSFAIDRRRLFDSLKDEMGGIVFVYSKREERLIFASPYVKNLIGLSSEKFIKEFPNLVLKGFPEWQQALRSQRGTHTELIIQRKDGGYTLFECLMGMVAKGPFTNHLIGILAPKSSG